jgi:sialate O-acetylesterase
MIRSGCLALVALLIISGSNLFADVKPNHLFSDHMVLQSDRAVPVWGTADAGEVVTVKTNGQTKTTTADSYGKWRVQLDALRAGGPFQMTIAGKNSITIEDVLVGEVWIGSGQSNMQFPVGPSPTVKAYNGVKDLDQEIAAADHPQLRMYTVKPTLSANPLQDTEGQWEVCTPQNVPHFSAIGYFFARNLQNALKVPVGVINSSFGASTAEAWVSKPAMDAVPELAGIMSNFQKALDAYAAHPATAASATATVSAASEPATRAVRNRRAPRSPLTDQHNPTLLWNAMLHPLQPYAMRGVIWYQGESVIGGTAGDLLYPTVMKTLVDSWREQWGEGDFPFYVCQLAGQDAASNNPIIRESQAAILSLSNTGMAVTIDIGEKKNVHPKDKQDVGDRLSRIALAQTYGKQIEYSGPTFNSMSVEGNSIRVLFNHLGGGLVAKGGGDLKTFTIAGADGKFVPATAKIDGDTVVVLSPDVSAPANVRYAWMNWPEGCNLFNAADLPAAPFRTDHAAGNAK